jgi:hypothetical protein
MLGRVNMEKLKKDNPARSEIFSHPIFSAVSEIIKGLEKLTFE